MLAFSYPNILHWPLPGDTYTPSLALVNWKILHWGPIVAMINHYHLDVWKSNDKVVDRTFRL